jgi:YggT family protein
MLRRFVPSIGKIDTSSIVLALALQMIADFSILVMKAVMVSFSALIILSFTQLISLILNVFIFAVFGRAILSWFDPGNYNPATSVLSSLTEPLLNLCRKVIPNLGGMDLSPLIAIMILQLAKMMLLPPLNQLAVLIG